jgi:hypothetical protein
MSESAASDSPAVPASLRRSESRGESRSSTASESDSDDLQASRCWGRPAGDPARGPSGLRVTRVRDAPASGNRQEPLRIQTHAPVGRPSRRLAVARRRLTVAVARVAAAAHLDPSRRLAVARIGMPTCIRTIIRIRSQWLQSQVDDHRMTVDDSEFSVNFRRTDLHACRPPVAAAPESG